jgi:hypothetical protein
VNKPTHTPKPWIRDGYNIRQPGGRQIAYVGPHHTLAEDYPLSCMREDERNGDLIAASPDLFAALEKAEIGLMNCNPNQFYDMDTLPAVRAAIAKAKGESK